MAEITPLTLGFAVIQVPAYRVEASCKQVTALQILGGITSEALFIPLDDCLRHQAVKFPYPSLAGYFPDAHIIKSIAVISRPIPNLYQNLISALIRFSSSLWTESTFFISLFYFHI